jgi:hypothetical protein
MMAAENGRSIYPSSGVVINSVQVTEIETKMAVPADPFRV